MHGGRTRQPPSRAAGAWVLAHPVEMALAALLVAASVNVWRVTAGYWFFADDWPLLRQAESLGGLVEPYNNHLSVIILGLYRGLVEVVGLEYTAFRFVSYACLLAMPVVYFLTTRSRLGAPVAALLGLSLLWADNALFVVAELNHYLALVFGFVAAAALDRGPRADGVLGAALVLSLLSAGGGVAVAVGCAVHLLCARPPLRRWLVVLLPSAAWALWWLLEGRARGVPDDLRPSLVEAAEFSWDLAFAAARSVGLGSSALAVVLLAVYAANAVRLLRHGLSAAANVVAWTAAAAFFGIVLAWSRGMLADANVFRYQVTAMALLALAVVPRRPSPVLHALAAGRWRYAAAAALVVVGAGQLVAHQGEVRENSRFLEANGHSARGEAVVLSLGPAVVADDSRLPFRWALIRAAEARRLLDRYGNPYAATAATADRTLLEAGVIKVSPAGTRAPGPCSRLIEPLAFTPGGLLPLYLWSDVDGWTAEVRLFGQDWVRLPAGEAGQALALQLPKLLTDDPWEVRAPDACRVGHRP